MSVHGRDASRDPITSCEVARGLAVAGRLSRPHGASHDCRQSRVRPCERPRARLRGCAHVGVFSFFIFSFFINSKFINSLIEKISKPSQYGTIRYQNYIVSVADRNLGTVEILNYGNHLLKKTIGSIIISTYKNGFYLFNYSTANNVSYWVAAAGIFLLYPSVIVSFIWSFNATISCTSLVMLPLSIWFFIWVNVRI